MALDDEVDEKPLVRGLIGLVVGLVAVCVLAGLAYFGSNADHSTTGSGEHSSLTRQQPPPPGTSGR
jgi:hypothetical protein